MDKKTLEKLNKLNMAGLEKVSVKNNKIIFSIRRKDHREEIVFDRDEFDVHQEIIKVGNDIEKAERMSIEENADVYLHIYNFLDHDVESIQIIFKIGISYSDLCLEQGVITPFGSKEDTYYIDRRSEKRIEIPENGSLSRSEFESRVREAKEAGVKYADITEKTVEIILTSDKVISFDREKFITRFSIGRNCLDMKWHKKLKLYGNNSMISTDNAGISFSCGSLSLWVGNKKLLLERENFIKEILEETKGKTIEITGPFRIENYKTRAELFCLFKILIKDFKIAASAIKKHYGDAYSKDKKDTAEIILIDAIKEYAGTTDKDFADAIPEIFHELLVECNGYSTDWKYDDKDVERQLNKKFLLGKHKLKIEFSNHKWDEVFEIRLIDLEENKMISSANYEYSKRDYHDQRELMERINKMIVEKGLVFENAEDGSDSFQFVLFDIPIYKKLKEKYDKGFDRLMRRTAKGDV